MTHTCVLRILLALLVCVAGACRSSIALPELSEQLAGAGIRTLVSEDDLALASPFGPGRTAEHLRVARDGLAVVELALGVEFPGQVFVQLVPLDVEGPGVTESDGELHFEAAPRQPTLHGVAGLAEAGGALRAVVFVARDRETTRADGTTLRETFGFDVEGNLRHELAHLGASVRGLTGPTWFDEGIALELEGTRVIDGRIVLDGNAPTILEARRNRGQASLGRVLAWDEDAARVLAGDEEPWALGRPFAHAWMRFLLERTDGDTLGDRFAAIGRLEPGALQALEADWLRWLGAPEGA